MHQFPRPGVRTLSVERTPVDEVCPECVSSSVPSYPVVGEEGWVAGYHRGGAAILEDTLWLDDVQHVAMPLHLEGASGVGTYGGGDGGNGGVWVFEPDAVAVAARLDPVTQVPDPEAPYQEGLRIDDEATVQLRAERTKD